MHNIIRISREKIINKLLLIIIFVSINCVPTYTTQSTGFVIGKNIKELPEGVPKRVGVSQFVGEYPINIQSTDEFSSGLIAFGFDVIERQQITAVYNELGVQQSGIIDDNTRIEIGNQLGIQGIFVGSVTGESNITWVDSHLNIKLVDIENGRIIWSASVKDPRIVTLSMDVRTSITHTTRNALNILKNDLDKLRR